MLKLEQELSEAKALQLKLSAKTSFLVSDIRKVRAPNFEKIIILSCTYFSGQGGRRESNDTGKTAPSC